MSKLQIVREKLRTEVYLQNRNLCDLNDVQTALALIAELRKEYGNSKDLSIRESVIARTGLLFYCREMGYPTYTDFLVGLLRSSHMEPGELDEIKKFNSAL